CRANRHTTSLSCRITSRLNPNAAFQDVDPDGGGAMRVVQILPVAQNGGGRLLLLWDCS
ncbi:hypothetical protein A2U01_0118490, partial [Trifolium medium]|nr:hypothetical protein [Trifolium medium]